MDLHFELETKMSSKFSCKKVVSISKRVNRELSNAFEMQGKDMFTVSLTEQNQCAYILHTVLCIFPKVEIRRVCLTIESFFSF